MCVYVCVRVCLSVSRQHRWWCHTFPQDESEYTLLRPHPHCCSTCVFLGFSYGCVDTCLSVYLQCVFLSHPISLLSLHSVLSSVSNWGQLKQTNNQTKHEHIYHTKHLSVLLHHLRQNRIPWLQTLEELAKAYRYGWRGYVTRGVVIHLGFTPLYSVSYLARRKRHAIFTCLYMNIITYIFIQ